MPTLGRRYRATFGLAGRRWPQRSGTVRSACNASLVGAGHPSMRDDSLHGTSDVLAHRTITRPPPRPRGLRAATLGICLFVSAQVAACAAAWQEEPKMPEGAQEQQPSAPQPPPAQEANTSQSSGADIDFSNFPRSGAPRVSLQTVFDALVTNLSPIETARGVLCAGGRPARARRAKAPGACRAGAERHLPRCRRPVRRGQATRDFDCEARAGHLDARRQAGRRPDVARVGRARWRSLPRRWLAGKHGRSDSSCSFHRRVGLQCRGHLRHPFSGLRAAMGDQPKSRPEAKPLACPGPRGLGGTTVDGGSVGYTVVRDRPRSVGEGGRHDQRDGSSIPERRSPDRRARRPARPLRAGRRSRLERERGRREGDRHRRSDPDTFGDHSAPERVVVEEGRACLHGRPMGGDRPAGGRRGHGRRARHPGHSHL